MAGTRGAKAFSARTTFVETPGSRAVPATWAAFLAQFYWSHFVTLTFRFAVSNELAMRNAQVWIRRLHQRNQRRVEWFLAMERGRLGNSHIHALLDASNLGCSEVREAWRYGFAEASYFDEARKGFAYVVKNITREDALYDISRSPVKRRSLEAEQRGYTWKCAQASEVQQYGAKTS